MILWRISSSQETKLSHLCPGAIWALSPGPARPPGSQSPKPHQRQPFVHSASRLCTAPATGLEKWVDWIWERGSISSKSLRNAISKLLLYCFIFMKINHSHCKSKQDRIMQSEEKNNLVSVHFSRVATDNRLMGLSDVFCLLTCVHAC